jgi:hypothetical protein
MSTYYIITRDAGAGAAPTGEIVDSVAVDLAEHLALLGSGDGATYAAVNIGGVVTLGDPEDEFILGVETGGDWAPTGERLTLAGGEIQAQLDALYAADGVCRSATLRTA